MLLKKENEELKQHKRISIYHQMLTSAVNYFPLEQKENFEPKKQLIFKNTMDFLLEGQSMKNTGTMENLKETSLL